MTSSEFSVEGTASVKDEMGGARKFSLGERVTKTKGASWTGRVVGFYETGLTPIGYAVESEKEPGSVQIYPEAALAAAPSRDQVTMGALTITNEMVERSAEIIEGQVGAFADMSWGFYQELARKTLETALASLSHPSSLIPTAEQGVVAKRVRHKKRGSEYDVLGVGKMQAEHWMSSRGDKASVDYEEVTVYRSREDGQIWVRPREEFEDGRFEELSPDLTPPIAGAGEEAVCDVLTMQHSSGFPDHFARVSVGKRELTFFMSKIKGQCEYHAAEFNWLLNGGDKPNIMGFNYTKPEGLEEYLQSIAPPADHEVSQLYSRIGGLERERDEWRVAFESKIDSNVRRVWKRLCDMALGQRNEAVARAEAIEIEISRAIGSTRFMDPPDGGSVTLPEQVTRMRQALEAAEAELAEAREVLEPLSKDSDVFLLTSAPDETVLHVSLDGLIVAHFTVGDFRRARSFHSPKESGAGNGG